MSQLWDVPPASTPFAPGRVNASFTRQVHSRVPITGDQFIAGRIASFNFKSTPDSLVHLPSSTIVVRMKVTDGAGVNAPPASVRFQHDPINAGLFNQAKYSVNGVTVSAVGANLGDLSQLHHRLTDTLEGTCTIGSSALIGNQKGMFPIGKQPNGGSQEHGGHAAASTPGTSTDGVFEKELVSENLGMSEREKTFGTNPKQSILQLNKKAGGEALEFELAAPIALPFWRQQSKAIGQNLEHQLELTVQNDMLKHMFYTQAVKRFSSHNCVTLTSTDTTAGGKVHVKGSVASSTAAVLGADNGAGVTMPLATAAVAAITDVASLSAGNGLKVTITDIYLNLCVIQPRAPIPRPLSTQYSWTDMTLLTRTLQTSQNYTEVFTIPISTKQIAVFVRHAPADIAVDREVYGGGAHLREFSLQRGSALLPAGGQYSLNPHNRRVARPLLDYNRILGATTVNARGGRTLEQWAKEPVLLFSSHTEEASSQITLRFSTDGTNLSASEIVVACFRTRVAEFTVDESGLPTSTVTDELVL